jgi:hypothetical protein
LTNEDVLSIVQELPLYIALKVKRLESNNKNKTFNSGSSGSNNNEMQKHQKRKVIKVKFSANAIETNPNTMSSKSLLRHELHNDSNLANIKV